MDVLAKYANGNTVVTIFDDGTKIREYEGEPIVEHPESIDVKITDWCDLGCAYCHESSTKAGLHGDLNTLLDVLSELPKGVELAIGGGNPLAHPCLLNFLVELKSKGFISNITVNQLHLKKHRILLIDLIERELVNGVGISISNNNFDSVKPFVAMTSNIVYHLIAGVTPVETATSLLKFKNAKILLLGYKIFGFGKTFYGKSVEDKIRAWRKALPSFIGKCTISFDNLAIEQLNVRRLFTDEGWEKFYMGDDFCFTMYIDAVKEQYAPTSRSERRKSFDECSLLEFFKDKKQHPVLS